MFIIPITRKPDWRRPPLATLLLILANVIIYFGWQDGDHEAVAKAVEYYSRSALPAVEFPAYAAYLRERERKGDAAAFERDVRRQPAAALMHMQFDAAFMRLLREGRVAPHGPAEQALWRDERGEFDRLLARSVTIARGFTPAEPRLATAFSHMFLHGSVSHLVGNMAVLAIVAYLVEEILGPGRFLLFYLLSGLGAAGLFWAVNPAGGAPLVGASGAISGVMGMYTALLGLRRINFFYSLVVYFDYVKGPAILLLPLWLANEMFQWWTEPYSSVAYMAHAGGLVTGSALAFLHRRRHSLPDDLDTGAEHGPQEAWRGELARAEELVRRLRLDQAREVYGRLARERPADRAILTQFYNLAKLDPAGEDYHLAVRLLLALPEDDGATAELVHRTYAEYLDAAKPAVRFRPEQLFQLARRFARHGYRSDAEKLAALLLKRYPHHGELPATLLAIAKACYRSGDKGKAQTYARLLGAGFPDSAEARAAALMIE